MDAGSNLRTDILNVSGVFFIIYGVSEAKNEPLVDDKQPLE